MSSGQYRQTVLAPGTSAVDSDQIVVMGGQAWTVALFVATGPIPGGANFAVKMKTPGGDITVGALTDEEPAQVIAGPGSYVVSRPDISGGGVAVGVFVEGR